MANLPITSKVLKACHKGMKVRDPLLKVGTVTKQTTQTVNLGNRGGEAEFQKELKKSTDLISGGNKTLEIDEAKDYGKVETDLDKYFKGLYERFGNDVTTQELIDKKYISKDAADAYNKVTGGKNVGIKQPDELVETEEEVDVLKKITPKTQENIGMSNFDARQQGRKSLQINRKLKRQKIKDARSDAKEMFPDDKKKQREYVKAQKRQAKKDQAAANRENFQNIADNIKTQTEQGSFGTGKYKTDEYRTKNQQLYDPQLKINADGSVGIESATNVFDRLNPGKRAEAQKNKPKTFFGAEGEKNLNEALSNIRLSSLPTGPFSPLGTMVNKKKPLKKNFFNK
jgi:hypothetical protein